MRKLVPLLALLLATLPAAAQFTQPPVAPAAATSGYIGPGDIQGSWLVWAGLRAFSGATAGTKSANVCNSGDANCADVNTLSNGNFDVTTAQGAPLNCGSTGGTCTIKTLYDKSGNANDAAQATIANRPTLVFSCLNTSLPCMKFDTSAGQAIIGGDVGHALPLTMSSTANRVLDTSGTNMVAFADNNGGTAQIQLGWPGGTPNTARVFQNGSSLTATASDATFHDLVGAEIAGAGNWAIYIDGTATTSTIPATSPSFGNWYIANSNFANETIEVSETGLINAGLNSTQAAALCHNKRLYWGTGGSC